MASVPSFYIKDKHIDYDGEIFACMGLPVEIAGLRVNPPSFGVYSLLEVADSMIIKDLSKSNAMDFCRALYIAYHGQDCAYDVQVWISSGGREKFSVSDTSTWLDLDKKVAVFAEDHHLDDVPIEDIARFRNFLVSNTFAGYEMIPNTSPSEFSPYIFGPESMAYVVMTAGYESIWGVPLCMIGHLAACKAKYNGTKGIRRPKDDDDISLQLKLAEEREAKGELHPWQIKEPDQYGLSAEQVSARPEIKDEYNKLLKEKLRQKREKRLEKEADKLNG